MEINNLEFRKSKPSELNDMALVLDRAKAKRDSLPLPSKPSSQSIKDIQIRLDRIGASAQIAVINDNIVGFALFHPLVEADKTIKNTDTIHLALLMVDPEHWGKRIASKLIDLIANQAKRAGRRYITLWTNEHNNERARALYEHKGFQKTGKSKTGKEGQQVHYQLELKRIIYL
jgi:GNAT superfamily N-acetyltransferase